MSGRASDLQTYATFSHQALALAASADLNGDGLLDLVGIEVNGGYFDVFFGQPDGGLSVPSRYFGSDGRALALGDLNRDGWPDVVISAGIVTDIFLNDGTGKLSLWASLNSGLTVAGLGIGDFNGDGVADVVVSRFLTQPDGPVFLDSLFLNEGGGMFGAPIYLSNAGGTLYQGLAVGDLNQDGLADIAAASLDGGQLVVLINQSDGGFQTTFYPARPVGEVILLPHQGGPPDLVLGLVGEGDGGFEVLRNSGQGAFPTQELYAVPGGSSLTVGDFNGDCIPDIATDAAENCIQVGSAISVLYGDADGGFGPVVSLKAAGMAPGGLAPLGPVATPRALAIVDGCEGGVTVYGDATKH